MPYVSRYHAYATIRDKVRAMPFTCRTNARKGPRPDKIAVEKYGHHSSYVVRGGDKVTFIRVWGFERASGGEQFVADYGGADA